MHSIPCPFVYANGRACTGRITRIATFKRTSNGAKVQTGLGSSDGQTGRIIMCSVPSGTVTPGTSSTTTSG